MARKTQRETVWRARMRPVRVAKWLAVIQSGLLHAIIVTSLYFGSQVLDRVLQDTDTSASVFGVLLGLVAGVVSLAGIVVYFRWRVFSRLAAWFDTDLAKVSYRAWLGQALAREPVGYKPMDDVALMREFMTTPTATAFFDALWIPIYVAVLLILHWQLGAALAGVALIVGLLILFSDLTTGFSQTRAAQADIQERRFADRSLPAVGAAQAMGMLESITHLWYRWRLRAVAGLQRGRERGQIFSILTMLTRIIATAAVGIWGVHLVFNGEMTAGQGVAAMLLTWIPLGPLERLAFGWPELRRTRLAQQRLMAFLAPVLQPKPFKEDLPPPRSEISVDGIHKFGATLASGALGRRILTDITFNLQPGEALGIVGPTAAGKTTLARILVGLELPDRGVVRLDSIPLSDWRPERLGPHVGYMPQRPSLFAGTIGQNISRFSPKPDKQAVVEAAELTGIIDMIRTLPEGFETEIDPALGSFSAGQTHRMALARAMYGAPRLVVLDEPYSFLDSEGQAALTQLIARIRNRGAIVVVAAQNPAVLAGIDHVLMIENGEIVDKGEKSEILRRMTRSA